MFAVLEAELAYGVAFLFVQMFGFAGGDRGGGAVFDSRYVFSEGLAGCGLGVRTFDDA